MIFQNIHNAVQTQPVRVYKQNKERHPVEGLDQEGDYTQSEEIVYDHDNDDRAKI